MHLVWGRGNSHQCYGPIHGLLIAMRDRLVLDVLILIAKNLLAGVLVRTT